MLATNQIVYPDSDGQPMADNTKQFQWITVIKTNLDWLFRDDERVFVAGDLLWYPVEGNPKYRVAPDVMVVFGRPKGDRGSYKQWLEDDLAPQVVFEILSPGNTEGEMERKLQIYARCGVEEYYIYDPDRSILKGYQHSDDFFLDSPGETILERIESINDWTSPRLGISFRLIGDDLQITHPDGRVFETFDNVATERDLLLTDKQQLEADKQQLEADKQQLESEKSKRDAKLRELGIDPDTL
ncbi:Uma2 family endonuclease [Chamaesiphon sp. OTE_20_metabat_361]|uniref:Uma2 family endonuclease n=1 Tax=Chamaesiphon sp. OTE_20_metabat_361 TaxID=2964689 RepID=UPI00286A53A3|nr:Uma2 family endonuclease [Chamaesiphon sp. OTE_20_metabat_361]